MSSFKKNLENRVHLIDEIRGFAIICMVVYHLFYDLAVIYEMNIPIFYTDFVQVLVTLFSGLFIFISGSACLYSRNNFKRGFLCFMLGMAATAFTYFFMRDNLDAFGILHMLGISMMLFELVKPLVRKINPVVGIVVCMFLCVFTYNVQNGYVGIGDVLIIDLPKELYQTSFLFPIGLSNPDFYSIDFFPLFPWLFCFLSGSFFGVLLKEKKLPECFYKMHIRQLAFIGRHTLIVYVVHQPIVLSLLYVIFTIVRK